ncbi:hypothetical protein ABS642_00895 [Microbacterium sp. A8/3-1]|uniref:Uncharacterized protein n=1 Tax=Microbacterium sp. A8/3-1 TaxID=3160749 RepID=A0AAU7VWD5_9MICO
MTLRSELPRLFHFTCDHGAIGIRESGMIQINRPPLPGAPAVLWLTDLEVPNRDGLGLTSRILSCDRTSHRFEVTRPHGVLHWNDAKREHFPRAQIEALEATPGAMPMHWYVSGLPQEVIL